MFNKILLLILFFILRNNIIRAQQSLWVFGKNDPPPGAVPIEEKNGEISLIQKLVRIPIRVSPCTNLIQVRVMVNNLMSTPEVKFSKQTNTVTISYRPMQSSLSTYRVTGDAMPIPYCNEDTEEDY